MGMAAWKSSAVARATMAVKIAEKAIARHGLFSVDVAVTAVNETIGLSLLSGSFQGEVRLAVYNRIGVSSTRIHAESAGCR